MSKAKPIFREFFLPQVDVGDVLEDIRIAVKKHKQKVPGFDPDRTVILMNEWVHLLVIRSIGDPMDRPKADPRKEEEVVMKLFGIRTVPCEGMTDKAFELREVQEQ